MKGTQISLPGEMDLPLRMGDLEEQAYSRGFRCVAGLDEVGRGPLAGPVVAAAVVLPRGFSDAGIKDSKVLTFKQRASLAPCIQEKALAWAIGVVEAAEIDRINILNASLLAMGRAIQNIRPLPDYLIIDGNHKIPVDYLMTGGFSHQAVPFQKPLPKGDRLCLSVAAASIIAKTTRDEMMMAYDRLYPEYGFASHKGYGSRSHLSALNRHGPLPIHRKSFKPVREICVSFSAVELTRPFRRP